MIRRPFEQWLFEEVEMEFDIERVKNMPELVQWLSISETEKVNLSDRLDELRVSLFDNVDTWNEDELKMFFISPFLIDFKFNNLPHYRAFTQRTMSLQTETVEANGRVEWMVATGKQRPRQPFFFLQEYQPEQSSKKNDPLGQLLIAMVDAQLLNQNNSIPIYGCYNIGRMWFFVLLVDKKYSVSRAYDATRTEDLADMVIIFKRVRRHIHQVLGLPIED